MAFFSEFQYGFGSSRSTADLLTVGSDRIAGVFNRSGATQAVALLYSMLLTEFGMLIFFTNLKLKPYGVSGQIFGLISSFLSNKWLRVVLEIFTRISS